MEYLCPFCVEFEADSPVDIEIHWSFGCKDYPNEEEDWLE